MRTILLLLLVLFFSSCEYINSLTEESDLVTEEVDCGSIKYIIVNSACKLELLPTISDTITVVGYEHLVDGLKLNVTNDSLIIEHDKETYLHQSDLIEIRIPANHLKWIVTFAVCEMETEDTITPDNLRIVINGVGKFTSANLSVENSYFMLHVYGTGNIGNYQVEGSSKSASFLLEGCVNIDASNFQCENVKVNHRSIKDCSVNASNTLNVSIYSTGNTYYSGNPELTFTRYDIPYFSSTGDVVQVNE